MVEPILKVAGIHSMLCRDFRLHLNVTRKDGIVEILNSRPRKQLNFVIFTVLFF